MNNITTHNQRIAEMTFSSVYPLYLVKIEKKGRTREELDQVIEWLTGFNSQKIQTLIQENVTFAAFFQQATLNPNAHLITGVICGYRVEEIQDPGIGLDTAPLFPPRETFEKIGGRAAVARLVDGLYDRIENDPFLRPAFNAT